MKQDFRIKLDGDTRAVSYRNIEVESSSNGIVVTPKGVKLMVRQYLKSILKNIYKLPISFKYYKSSNGLDIYIQGITGDELRDILTKFDQFTIGNAIRDVKTNYLISFDLRSLSILNGTSTRKRQSTPRPTPQTPTSGKPKATASAPQTTPQTPTPQMPTNTPAIPSNTQPYILTREEMKLTYGDDWEVKVEWFDEMNSLFGRLLTDEETKWILTGIDVQVTDNDGEEFFINAQSTSLNLITKYPNYTLQQFETITEGLNIMVDAGSELAANAIYSITNYIKNNNIK